MDKIRVLRVIEYEGPRDEVEEFVAASVHGQRRFSAYDAVTVRVATIGAYPEILQESTPPAA